MLAAGAAGKTTHFHKVIYYFCNVNLIIKTRKHGHVRIQYLIVLGVLSFGMRFCFQHLRV